MGVLHLYRCNRPTSFSLALLALSFLFLLSFLSPLFSFFPPFSSFSLSPCRFLVRRPLPCRTGSDGPVCQYRTKLPHAPKVKIMNLLTITYKCTCIGWHGGGETYWTRFIHILEWLVQLTHRFMMQGKQLFIVHAAFLSQYLECLLNVVQSRTSYPKLVRGPCNFAV